MAKETNALAGMFLFAMQRDEKGAAGPEFDWKAAGYITSIVSVLFLAAVAWYQQHAPRWYYPALIAGVVTSILGMAFRYKAHLDQKRKIARAEQDARAR